MLRLLHDPEEQFFETLARRSDTSDGLLSAGSSANNLIDLCDGLVVELIRLDDGSFVA